MRMVIEVRFDSDFVDSNPIRLCTIERTGSIDDAIGLALAERRTLLASVQAQLVRALAQGSCPDSVDT
jgi:hypothetical protein